MNEKTLNQAPTPSSAMDKFLNGIERAGNKIPDPALLFFWGLIAVWVLSAIMSQFDFGLVHPVTQQVVQVNNLLTGDGKTDLI